MAVIDVRFQRCQHCGELIGTARFYICIPEDQPDVRWFFHNECLESEAVVVVPEDGR